MRTDVLHTSYARGVIGIRLQQLCQLVQLLATSRVLHVEEGAVAVLGLDLTSQELIIEAVVEVLLTRSRQAPQSVLLVGQHHGAKLERAGEGVVIAEQRQRVFAIHGALRTG